MIILAQLFNCSTNKILNVASWVKNCLHLFCVFMALSIINRHMVFSFVKVHYILVNLFNFFFSFFFLRKTQIFVLFPNKTTNKLYTFIVILQVVLFMNKLLNFRQMLCFSYFILLKFQGFLKIIFWCFWFHD